MTITELMIAVTILGFAMMMALGFFTESVKATFVSEQKNLINNDIRKLTGELSGIARQANYFLLYDSFASQDRNGSDDRRHNGRAGDFLVFVFQEEPDIENPLFAPLPVSRLVGYYRSPENPSEPTSMGPVRKFEIDVDAPSDPTDPPTVESLLPPESSSANHTEVLALSEGLADNRLFYNFGNGSAMINGKIVHGVEAKRVTDTYNFTITTR